ncbi:hypothetical protein DICSQDRAFT_165553 [Dichomitus squalens LYAD-421 SS1]|uniref:uncharacterized protein n=1 Tax=Dichomitus squalens (strain LYAD-421) TaxID=732165 RepID=UPI0004411E79|nr:uncharacterized protein DICSQDRAFT_165553 [Dichomitus squalens LYAD-421 SS1]EJF65853.1 hypothetical protein DICSQDRAFT_165553 [Dichomitus squalens LYAD-421 SS1]
MDLPPLFVTDKSTPPTDLSTRTTYQAYAPYTQAPDTTTNDNVDREEKHSPAKQSHAPAKHSSKSKAVKGKPKAPSVLEVQAQDVPGPAPDTGLPSPRPLAEHPVHTGILPIIPSQSPTTLTVPPVTLALASGLSALPPLTALATRASRSPIPTPSLAEVPNDPSRALGANQPDHDTDKGPSHTQIVVAVLVSVGIIFMFLSVLVFWRWRNRPRKRTCPTPSLPIFQDPFTDQDLKVDDESLFGGKDNDSSIARPPSNGIYPWVQYTPRPSEGLAAAKSKSPLPNLPSKEPLAAPKSALISDKPVNPVHVKLPAKTSTYNEPPANPPVQQMQTALTRAAHRVSAMSMSIYPTSPQSNAGIGIAIGGASPLTGDGTPMLNRKPSRERAAAKDRQSFRHSLGATEYRDIYGGAQATSPLLQPPAPTAAPPMSRASQRRSMFTPASGPGRARVQPGYTPGAATATLRASSTVAGITTLARPPGTRASLLAQHCEPTYVLPPLSPALKSDARRERDTRALTSALGLATPSAPAYAHAHEPAYLFSPAATLHPDDSITLAGDRELGDRRRSFASRPAPPLPPVPSSTPAPTPTHHRAQSEAPMSPGTEASARLGNLMLAEFTASMASLPSARIVGAAPPAHQGAQGQGQAKTRAGVPRKNVSGSRADDRPPRVPSPPPLPSLAQMAMAHANPEAYDDYRSPTYSIYGLYETERRSRAQGAPTDF